MVLVDAQNDQANIALFTSTRGGGDPVPPCVAEKRAKTTAVKMAKLVENGVQTGVHKGV